MFKKSIKFLISMVLLAFMCITNTAFAMENDNNPIDAAFAQSWNEAGSTVEMNYVAEKYMMAWRAEMNHVALMNKEKYKFDEDKKRIEDYIVAYEQVAGAAIYVEWLNWSDTEQNPKGRNFGTGAASASLSSKANIYKQATLNLIKAYQGNGSDNNYNYIYSGTGAELAKKKLEMQEKIKH